MIDYKNINDPASLKNKVVVVAGGSNKAGRAIAEEMAQTGASIVIADANLINAAITVQHLKEKYKIPAVAVGPNIGEIKSITGEGSIDVWVNAWSLNKNIHDFFALSNEAASYIKKSNVEGMIINIIPVKDWGRLTGFPDITPVDEYVPEIIKFLTLQNNNYGSHFRDPRFINCFCISAHGWVNGTEFRQKVLAMVLDILSDTIV
jgi:NAD(P)-dependent dehydrogenase (short-subunit alcohol dehydrogenase family)